MFSYFLNPAVATKMKKLIAVMHIEGGQKDSLLVQRIGRKEKSPTSKNHV